MYRIICEEIYARAVPSALLADERYEWRVFLDLGGDLPFIYDITESSSRAIEAVSEEGRTILGGIDLDALHETALAHSFLRQEVHDAIAAPPENTLQCGLYRLLAAVAAHASQSSLTPFRVADVADRIFASRFDPEEIALDLGPYRDDVQQVASYINEQEWNGQPYWAVIAELLELP